MDVEKTLISAGVQQIIQLTATIIGISGGLLALFKYFSDKREKELREWQKVVIYKIFRQNEASNLHFSTLLDKYRSEANAFVDIDLKKREISEDSLRRILLELVSSNILSMELTDSFRLKVNKPKADPVEASIKINALLAEIVGANPFIYTLDEVAKQMSPVVNESVHLLKNNLRMAVEYGNLLQDEKKRLAFPTDN